MVEGRGVRGHRCDDVFLEDDQDSHREWFVDHPWREVGGRRSEVIGHGSTTKTSRAPRKLIKRTEENVEELEGDDIEFYRKTMGKLIYLSIDRRDLKYVAKELARRMQKPRKVDMELLKSAGRYLAG